MQPSVLKVAPAPVRELRAAVRGEVVGPGDPGYDRARAVFYTGFNRRPAAIVRPADAQDVSRVVSLAREAGVELAVRSGGHSVAGHSVCEGGIVLDLSALRALEVDPAGRTAWAGTGLTAGEYTAAVGAHGLATGFGDAPSVGIGGITLGGGVGFLHRRYGLTIDSLLAAEVVTADGRVLLADEASHPDLFWAIRGGGGNFGVATRFRYRLHEVDDVVGGVLVFPATPESVVAVVQEAMEAPEELAGMINVMPAPPMPFLPAELHGKPIVMAVLVHCGGAEAGERAFARLRALRPAADLVRPMRFPEMYAGAEGAPHPAAIAARSFFLDSLQRAEAERILEGLRTGSAPMRVAQLRVLGGAVARVSTDATAFAHRGRGVMATVAAAYERPGEAAEHEAWADAFARELRQGEPGAYVGFLGDEGEARVREAYPGATWDRLAAVKARYDPGNLFRLNQNVPPAGGAA